MVVTFYSPLRKIFLYYWNEGDVIFVTLVTPDVTPTPQIPQNRVSSPEHPDGLPSYTTLEGSFPMKHRTIAALAAATFLLPLAACSSQPSIDEVISAVCDGGVADTEDGYDYTCPVKGEEVLITDWSGFNAEWDELRDEFIADPATGFSLGEEITITGNPRAITAAHDRLAEKE